MQDEHLDGLAKLFKEYTPPPHTEGPTGSKGVDLGDAKLVVEDTPV